MPHAHSHKSGGFYIPWSVPKMEGLPFIGPPNFPTRIGVLSTLPFWFENQEMQDPCHSPLALGQRGDNSEGLSSESSYIWGLEGTPIWSIALALVITAIFLDGRGSLFLTFIIGTSMGTPSAIFAIPKASHGPLSPSLSSRREGGWRSRS